MKRRELLSAALTASTAGVFVSRPGFSDESRLASLAIVDTNISLFHWPFRRLPLDDSDSLDKKLRNLGVFQAWASSFEAILHRDVASVNARLAAECKRYSALIPIGTVNPHLPDWQEDLRRCSDVFSMPGIRLYPNYHGYDLADARFEQLLALATRRGMLVQIAVAMEDARTQHPMLQVPEVDLSPLPSLMQKHLNAKVQILNYRPTPAGLKNLASTPGIFFDTARVEGTDGIAQLVHSLPAGRVWFGSHAPFLIPEAALIRVHESGHVSPTQTASDTQPDMLTQQEFRSLMWESAGQVCKK